jgi:penicillin-binding protein 1A
MAEWHLKGTIMAWHVEHRLTKEEILAVYLNNGYFGNNAYGVGAAARIYFNQHAADLSLAESALIVGLYQAPAYNPFRSPEAAKARQMHVLDSMRALGWITDEECRQAAAETLAYRSMAE